MSDDTPQAMREGHWSEWGSDGDDQDGDADGGLPTVRDRILAQLDADEIHGVLGTFRNGQTVYLVISHSTNRERVGPVLDLRTVVVDLADETVRVTDNNLWVPQDADVAGGLTSILARTQADLSGSVPGDAPPLTESPSDDVDLADLLDREVADDYDPAEPRDWGYGEGPPPEIDRMNARLREAGVETVDRYILLNFGSKSPFGESHHFAGADGLKGNYGVYARQHDPLMLVDVDDPDALDVQLPETFRVTSPHGDDDRAHHYYVVDDVEAIHDEFGKVNFGPTWGDVRGHNQFVVGPGAQVSECRKDDHGPDCPVNDPDGGQYEILDDREIATVSAEWMIDLLDSDSAVTRSEDDDGDESDDARDEGASGASGEGSTPAVSDDAESDESGRTVECTECGAEIPESAGNVIASDDDRDYYVCAGGCDS